MRVLHVINRLAVGGAEKVFVSLTNDLYDHGIDVSALVFETGYDLEKGLKVDLVSLNRKNKFNLSTLYKAHKICLGYDIIHAHLRHVHAYLKLAKILFGGPYRLILHDHAGVSDKIPLRLKSIFKPYYYIGVIQKQVDWAIDILNITKQNAFLLNNLVVPPADDIHTSASAAIMMVANIRRVKNIEFGIDLARKLNKPLTIYGNVLDETYYQELLQKIGDKDDVKIKTGIADLREAYHEHSMAIHTSKEETGPLVLLEYMYVGMPFVAFKTGSVADTVANDLKENFIDSFEMEDWVNQINRLSDSEETKQAMKQLYDKYYSAERIREKCLEIYKSVHS